MGSSSAKQVRIYLSLSFVGLNLVIGGVVYWLKLPVYLDSLGIVLTTILLGWRSGVLVALLTVGLGFFVTNPYLPFYTLTSLAIVATVETLRRRNMYATPLKSVISGVLLAVVAAFVSAPVTAYLFGGVTASGVDLLTALLVRSGQSLVQAVVLSGLASEPVDKIIVTLSAVAALRGLPNSFLNRFSLRKISD